MKRRYINIDSLRFIASLGIVMVHVLKNIDFYDMPSQGVYGYIYALFLMRMEKFVSLFFLISGFSISCGYYHRVKDGNISMNDFFSKRYRRILPLFAAIVLVEAGYLFVTHNLETIGIVFESMADLTLVYSFLPASSISIVGVGWALDVIFAFYIIYPFIVFCTWTKKRGWISLFVAVFLSYSARTYFANAGSITNCNIAMWAQYFIAGVVIYLYIDQIGAWIDKSKLLSLGVFAFGFFLAFFVSMDSIFLENVKNLLSWSIVLISALGQDWSMSNTRIVKLCSQYSFDIYLLHMMVLRLLQKCHLVFYNGILGGVAYTAMIYLFALLIAYLFSLVLKRMSPMRKRST
ncbi:MAG: acyltransferase [Lachnospiraceae bacterium]|nr:acyltransferase [Lachnospiraceae bacterium]